MTMKIEEILEERILVLDGAMGTMIQQYDLTEDDFRNDELKDHSIPLKGNNDLLSLTRPDIIASIHKTYFEAGADIAETNTFTSTSIAQEDYKCEHLVYKMNFESARIAKEVAREFSDKEPNKPRFVAGSIGPTNRSASMSPDVNRPAFRAVDFDDLVESYYEQAVGLYDGGVDIFLIETVFDTLNAKAALYALDKLFSEKGEKRPVMVSGTITDASGRTLSGQTAEAFLISVSHFPLLSIGFNCALGAEQLKPYVGVLSRKADLRVSAHPNAGLPNEFGEYDQTPEEMAQLVQEFLDEDMVNIVGGCCGTGPDHIRKIAELVQEYEPRKLKSLV